MVDIKFIKTKYNTLLKHNNTKVSLNIRNCTCVKSIYQDNNKTWYIKLKLPNDIVSVIQNIDNQSRSFCNTEYLNSITNNNEIKVKIPYRYKKFECIFKDAHDRLIISSDINTDDILCLNIECVNLWTLVNDKGTLSGLLWKTQLIKQM